MAPVITPAADVDSVDSGIPVELTPIPDFTRPEKAFDFFCTADRMSSIVSSFNRLCDLLNVNPADDFSGVQVGFYRVLRKRLSSHWKARQLFSLLDKKVQLKVYKRKHSSENTKALVIGAGPAGLRCAIELAMLGSKVMVLEKRDSFSRNNVLHLWPFLLHDLKMLGAKIFFGLFCTGSLDHISIRTLQCILLKVCLLLGVQVFVNVEFSGLIEPDRDKGSGWQAKLVPSNHFLSSFEFNVVIGASGKQFSLEGFKRKVFRGTLAIAITANFVNRHTPAEIKVAEISGVAVIYNQKFFKDLSASTGIDLENIVYYKNETHYFVMTAKKASLLAKQVLRKDCDVPADLLNPKNICREALRAYALEAANFATQNQLPNLEFELTQTGQPDVALFDFTNIFQAEYSTRFLERAGQPLLMSLIGDSLLEPFWPTGSGCARGFLSALDAAWTVRRFTRGRRSVLELLAERESVYQRLSQTEPRNIVQSFSKHTLDPRTRYPSLNTNCYKATDMRQQVDSDDPLSSALIPPSPTSSPSKRRGSSRLLMGSYKNGGLADRFHQSPPSLDLSLTFPTGTGEGEHPVSYASLVRWFQIRLDRYSGRGVCVTDLVGSWKSGIAFLCLLHAYKPELVEPAHLQESNAHANCTLAFHLFKREFDIEPVATTEQILSKQWDQSAWAVYLKRIYDKLKNLTPSRAPVDTKTPETADPKRPSKSINQTRHSNKMAAPSKMERVPSSAPSSSNPPSFFAQKGLIGNRRNELYSAFGDSNQPVRLQKFTPIPQSTGNVSQLQQKLFGSRENSNPTAAPNNNQPRQGANLPQKMSPESHQKSGQPLPDTAHNINRDNITHTTAEGRYRSGSAPPARKTSSVRRSQAFLQPKSPPSTPQRVPPIVPPHGPSSASSVAALVSQDRLRSASEPQHPQGLKQHKAASSLPDEINLLQQVLKRGMETSSAEIWTPVVRKLSWEEALAKCRQMLPSDPAVAPGISTEDPGDVRDGAGPVAPPRTVFLDLEEEHSEASDDNSDVDGDSLTQEPRVIVIGEEGENSRLSDITECDSRLERSRGGQPGTLATTTLSGVETIPHDEEHHYANYMPHDGSLSGTFAVEKGRKKVTPLCRFESLVRDMKDLQQTSGDSPPIYDTPNVAPPSPAPPTSGKIRLTAADFRPLSDSSSDSSELDAGWDRDALSSFDPARDADPNLTWHGRAPNLNNGQLVTATPAVSGGKSRKKNWKKTKKPSKLKGLFQRKKSCDQQLGRVEEERDHRANSFNLDHDMHPSSRGGLRKFKSEGNLYDETVNLSYDSSNDIDEGLTPWSSNASLGYPPSEEDSTAVEDDMDPSTPDGKRNLQLVRLRQAQEIQRQLQEVEVLLAELELKGADTENRLRRVSFLRDQGNKQDPKSGQETDQLERKMHDEILVNVAEKNQLVRFESELTIQAKEMELVDRQDRLKEEYSKRVEISDKHKTKDEMLDDKKVLQEYLSVVEERNSLVLLLEEQRRREQTEDSHLLTALARRGIHFFPMSYVTKIRTGTTRESQLI